MPRYAREKSGSGIYHVMLRGIDRQEIFRDEEDCRFFLDTVGQTKQKEPFSLYAYCLMGNHVHLLIQEEQDNLATIMKRIGVRYAGWFNLKYQRVGHVFQDRYKSETVEDDGYLLTVLRYIHQNPTRAGLAETPGEYCWSSCGAYYGAGEPLPGLTDTVWVLGLFAGPGDGGRQGFKDFTETMAAEMCLEVEGEIPVRMNDAALDREIRRILGGRELAVLKGLEKGERDAVLRQIKAIPGVSQRQIARVTGVGQSLIFKV